MKNQIDQSTPFLAFYDLLRIRGIYSTEEKREKLHRGFRRAMALAAVLFAVAAPQGALALPGGLAGDPRVTVSGNTMTIRPNGNSAFSWDSFNVAGGETVTIDATSIHTAPSFDIAGRVDAGSNVLVFKTPGGNIAVSGTINAGRFYAATFGAFNYENMTFTAQDVAHGEINITGSIPSGSVLVGHTIASAGAAGTVVATADMADTSEITIASGGGTITFKGTMGANSILKAGSVTFEDDATADGSVEATDGDIGGNFAQSGGTVKASGDITGSLTQSGGEASAKNIGALTQSGGTASATEKISSLTQSGTTASATAGTVTGNATVTGSLQGNGGLTIGGTLDSSGTVTGNGAVTVTGAATQTGGTISAGNSALTLSSGGTLGGTVTAGSIAAAGQTVTQNGGTISLGSGTLTADSFSQTGGEATFGSTAADVNQTAGTINATTLSGAVTQNGGTIKAAGATGGLTLSQAITTQNGTLDGNGGTITLAGGSTLSGTVTGDSLSAGTAGAITQNGGTISLGSGSLTAGTFSQTGGTATFGSTAAAVNQTAGTINATTLSGAVNQTDGTITATTLSGAVTQNGGSINGDGGLTVGSLTQSGGTIQADGTLTINGAASQTGGTVTAAGVTLAAGTAAVTLDQTGNDLSSVSGTAGAVKIGNAGALSLGTLSASSLEVTAGGAVTQTGAATVSGTTTVTADGGDADITLANAGNKLGDIALTGKSVSVRDSEGDIDLKDVSATDSITAVASAGTVKTSGTPIETGSLDVTAGNGAITLDTKVASLKVSATGDITITDKSDQTTAGVTIAGATSDTGNIKFESDNNKFVVGGAVAAGEGTGGAIKISGSEVNAAVSAKSGQEVDISGKGHDLVIGANLGSDDAALDLSADRDVIVKSGFTVRGKTVSLTADANGGEDEAGTEVGGVYVGGTVRSAEGDVTLTGTKLALAASGTGAPDEAKGKGVYFGGGRVDSTGNVTIVDKSGNDAIETGAATIAANGGSIKWGADGAAAIDKDVSATGALNLSQKDELKLENNVSTGTAALTLASTDGAVTTAETASGALRVDAGGAVTLGTTGASSLTVNAGGDVTQTGAATISGIAQINAAESDVTLDNAENAFGSIGVAGANVTIKESDATTLRATTASGTLTVTSGGAITQNGDVAAVGATTLDAGANAITLNRAGNDFGGTVTVANTPGAVSLRDENDLTVADLTSAGAVTLQAGGALSTGAVAANGGNATLAGRTIAADGAVTASQAVNATATAGATFSDAVTAGTAATLAAGNGALQTQGAVAANGGNATLTGASVTTAGAVSATRGNAALTATAGGLAVGGTVNARNAILEATGAIAENAAVNATAAKSVHTTGGAITVATAAAGFTAPTTVYQADRGAVTIGGEVSGVQNLGVQGASITQNGFSGVNNLALYTTGTGAATYDDAAIPTGVQNLGLRAAGDLTVDVSGALTANGATVTANGRTVAANGIVSDNGAADVTAGGAINASSIAGGAGTTVNANGGTEAAGGNAINVTGNIGQGGATTIYGASVAADTLASGGLLTVNVSGDATADIDAGGDAVLNVGGDLDSDALAAGGDVALDVGGDAGVGDLDVDGDLSGDVGGQFTTDGGNVGSIGQDGFTAGGIQIDGNLDVAGDVDVEDGGDVVLNGDLNAGDVDIAGDSITGGGVLTADALTLDMGGNVGAAGQALTVQTPNVQNVQGANVYLLDTQAGVVTLGAVTATGNQLTLTFDNATQVNGNGAGLTANNGNITLTVNAGQFGSLDNPIPVNLGGTLTLDGANAPLLHIVVNGDAAASDLVVQYLSEGFAIYGSAATGWQIIGIGPEKQRLLNRALAFSVNTPELKSAQGIFGDPAMLHTKMNVAEARPGANMDMLALKSVDFSETWLGIIEADLSDWNPAVDTTDMPLQPKLESLASEVRLQPEIQPARAARQD